MKQMPLLDREYVTAHVFRWQQTEKNVYLYRTRQLDIEVMFRYREWFIRFHNNITPRYGKFKLCNGKRDDWPIALDKATVFLMEELFNLSVSSLRF